MHDPAEVRWIKSTANELNNLLQVIADSSELLAGMCREAPGATPYLTMLRDSVGRAAVITRNLADRAGGSPTDRITAAIQGTDEEVPRLFPAERMPQPPVSSAPPHVEIFNPTGKRELIMVVDDEAFITMLASEVLSEEGYRVVTAKDGFQALDIYGQLKDEIALVILDFAMPAMDGSDVFAGLQRMNPEVSVILSSGFAEQDRLRAMLARGLRGFLPKPYSFQKLLDLVRQTLNGQQTGRA